MADTHRLPLRFDPARLQADLGRIAPEEWVPHFNIHYHDGGWSGVALRSAGGDAAGLFPDPHATPAVASTPLLARCPYMAEVLDRIRCPQTSARLLKLASGSSIREHRDYELAFEDGEIRLHIPVATSLDVEFALNGQPIIMAAGECWYLNLNLPHRVANRGRADRVHLVVDCVVNDWLRSQFPPEVATAGREGFERFHAVVLQDRAIQETLAAVKEAPAFASTAVRLGRERGFLFSRLDVEDAIRAGRRWVRTVDLTVEEADPRHGWVPFRVDWHGPEPMLQWCRIGPRRFAEPFFEETLASVMAEPFASAFRRITPLDALTDTAVEAASARPTGFIFHMSRCGSTLVAQALAALPGNIVLSEAGPIDAILRATERIPGLDDRRHLSWIRGMVLALGQRRNPGESRLFVKFDCWHTLALPLIRRAFPDVPWIFVYREPVEVIVSHLRRLATQMMPGIRPPGWFELDLAEALAMPPEEYTTRVLAMICEAAIEHSRLGGSRFVNYRDLPEAAWLSASEHFGIRWSAEEVAQMERTARLDTKNPGQTFRDDSSAKRAEADPLVLKLADAWLRPLHEQMEALRLADR